MTEPSEQQISNINLGRMSARDYATLASVKPETPNMNALVAKVQAVFERLRGRGITDDFDVAMLGVELHHALDRASWNHLRTAVSALYGPEAGKMLSLRVEEAEHLSSTEGVSSQVGLSEVRSQLHHLREQVSHDERVSPHIEEIVSCAKSLRKFAGDALSIEGFVGDLVLTLAEVGKRRNLPTEAVDEERKARAIVSHELSRLIIQEAPEQRIGWSFMAYAYEQEYAFPEAELVHFHNVQAFDTGKDWEGLLILLGRLDGRAEDVRRVGAEAVLRYWDSFNVVSNLIRAMLRLDEIDRDLHTLLTFSTSLLFADLPREDLKWVPTQYFTTINILALDRERSIAEAINDGSVRFIERYAMHGSIDGLRWIPRQFRNGALFVRELLNSARKLEPELWTQELDDILAFSHAFGSITDQEYARTAGYKEIRDGSDVPATRRWLAQLLIKIEGNEAVHEAARLLVENIEKYEDENSRVLLKQLENAEVKVFLSGIESKGLDADPRRLKGVGIDHTKTNFFDPSIFSPTSYSLSNEIVEIGALKQIELCKGEDDSLLEALRGVEPSSTKGRAQMEILEARHRDLADAQEPGSFAAKFEHALRTGELELLNRIKSGIPSLLAITVVAKSLFGDKEATQDLLTFFSEDESFLPTDQLLIQRLKKRLSSIDISAVSDPVRLGEVLQMERQTCVVLLRDANEAHALLAA